MSEEPDFRVTIRLIKDAQDGDSKALGRLCERYQDRFLERIRAMLGHEVRGFAQSVDLLQDLFVDLVRDFDRFEIRDDEAFLRWAVRVARNNIRDLARRQRYRRMEELAQSAVFEPRAGHEAPRTPADEADRSEKVDLLREALQRLPADYRRVIELRDFDGLPYSKVAELLDRPSEAAAQMLYGRALARLTRLMHGRD